MARCKVANRLDKDNLAGTVVMIQIRTADWRNQTRSRTVLNPLYIKNKTFIKKRQNCLQGIGMANRFDFLVLPFQMSFR